MVFNHFAQLLSDQELNRLHDSALALLENPGMKIESPGLLKALQQRGATVDFAKEIVRFPSKLVEETLEIAARQEGERLRESNGNITKASNCLAFSWHTAFPDGTPEITFSFGGGCPLFYDYPADKVREATAKNFLDMIHLAEGLPEVVTAGNPVHHVVDFDGKKTHPRMMAIKGAALVAKNSSKPGSTALMEAEQLEYLVEIGTVIRGSFKNYQTKPLFININDTVPPLKLSRPEGAIIEALIKKGLPVFILPMPMMGISGPVFPLANAVIGAAEILGVWTAVKVMDPEIPVECSIVSGVMEPKTGAACFSAPETAMQDVMVAQLFRKRYHLRCGIGAGFIDAAVPGTAAAFERTMKCGLAAGCGEFSFPVGILAAGNIYSPEQAMIDMDIAAGQQRFFRTIQPDFESALSLIREKGIEGMFFDTDHTVGHFRKEIWMPRVFTRSKSKDSQDAKAADPVRKAYERWTDILKNTTPFELESDKAEEIDKIVQKAEKHLTP